MDFAQLAEQYRDTLLNNVIPFWMKHAIDPRGGINTCITDEGQIVNRDKWCWSQWRAVYLFSKLYNRIEARPEWLKVARDIYAFLIAHGPLDNGHWPLLLDGQGRILRGYESIYVDGFALYGMTELYRATRDESILEQARSTFRVVDHALHHDDPLPAWPYPIPSGRLNHGVSMLMSLTFHELAEVARDVAIREAALSHHHRVMGTFLRPARGLLLEWVYKDGREVEPPDRTVCLPGHAIESMWFQIHIARDHADRPAIDRAVRAIRRHLEIGWDQQYGGLFLAVDADGGPEVAWRFADSKLWWPHTEALYATLLAYEYCRENWCIEWHERIREYSYSHYPVAGHGEWTQKLDRQGRPIIEVVALPVKDPFHLPRALMYCIESAERLTQKS